MTTARHHAEWLSLVETSGPFLSLPVLLRVFPQDLDGRDPARAARLREAYEDWLDRGPRSFAVHQAWVRHVLIDLLGYPADLLAEGQNLPPGLEASQPQHGETLRPDLALRHRDPAGRVQLLIKIYPPAQNLAKAVTGTTWNASPGTRMMELLHAVDLPLGLVTNGEQWMLVYAPRGETTGFASWFADLWMQEPLTLRAFHSLLHVRRFIGVAEADTLSALFAESVKDQQEVTDQLGKQVRQAVEMLVQAFDRIDADSQRTLLAGVEEKDLYNAALTVMMRLVFLFSAEERELLPLNDGFYAENYAAATLSAYLRERADQFGEEVLERRHDAWSRLLATFRTVHGGVLHDRLQIPAYGGSLFDPDVYPFLEGRPRQTRWASTPAVPLPINNRVVLHLLEALQFLRVKVGGGGPAERRRLSFRALDIEQIGHVYEGLLDHTARRASELILGLTGKREPEVALAKLESLAAAAADKLTEYLTEETGRTAKAIGKALTSGEPDEFALQHACQGDMRLVARLRPYADLLRSDTFGRALVVHPGSVYVTAGSDRRSTGTHYTPRSLTEPIVQHTLEPLVYIGPAEGKPRAEWKLRSAREILAIKVCDLAMGSGAFLVQCCRYLAERLVEAWEIAERANPGKILATPEGDFSAGAPSERLIPADPAERLAIARRYVADRCLYGVDINPMAVEMAKLSLWLITLQRDRPFTFLDHALKCGDSLLGVSSVQQIENFSLRSGHRQVAFATANLFRYVEEASAKRRALEDLPSNDHTQIETKNRLHAEAEAAIAKVKALADCLIAFELRGLDGNAYEEQRADEAEKVQLLLKRDADASLNAQVPTTNQLSDHAREQLRGRLTFHWSAEFPEVFARGGFDAFVGNPPFMGGQKITGILGTDYRDYLLGNLANGTRGSADLCAYFFLRAHYLLREKGAFGLIATNTIAQGDTREVGLEQLAEKGAEIFRAISSQRWPGQANLEIACVGLFKGVWGGQVILDETEVPRISPFLTTQTEATAKPEPLVANENKSFQGSIVLGMGFVLTPESAAELIKRSSKNSTVVIPYLIGEDFNTNPDQTPTRWVINFQDWPHSRAAAGHWAEASEAERRDWLKGGFVPADYPNPVAADFPEVLDILTRLVKPDRTRTDQKGEYELRYPLYLKWWIYAEKRPALYATLRGRERTLVRVRISPTPAFCFVPANQVIEASLVVFPLADDASFAVLQSSVHFVWAQFYTPTFGRSTFVYAPSHCYDNFAFPDSWGILGKIGLRYQVLRAEIMRSRQEGLTDTYNRFHDRGEQSSDIERLRALHGEMDQAVAAAYGWTDLDLGHGFHATKQGERYTLSEPARRTVLDKLLELNHRRYAEEVKAGLHDKKGKKASPGADGTTPAKRRGGPAKTSEPAEPELF